MNLNLKIENNFQIQNKKNKIKPMYLCSSQEHKGENILPLINWNKIPEADFYSLILEDPDAPKQTFVHMYLPIIPNNIHELSQKNINKKSIIKGFNSQSKQEYLGPCNPFTQIHHYHFILYACKGNSTSTNQLTKLKNIKELIKTKNHKEFEEFMKKHGFHILEKDEKIFKYKL